MTRVGGEVDLVVGRARMGEPGAFDRLVELTYGDAYTLAYRLTGNEHDAADVVQETYLRVYRSLDGFRGDARFTTWLYRITANCASSHLGRRRRHRHEQLKDDEPLVDGCQDHDPEHRVDSAVLRASLEKAIAQLSPGLRAVVVLRDVYELPHVDIAEELGISVTAAKVRLHRARGKLRDLVAASDQDGERRERSSASKIAPRLPDQEYGEELRDAM